MRAARSLYEVLQVDPRAEPEVLEAAFRRLARKYHPDVSTAVDGVDRMKQLNAAYEVLRDAGRRAAYDQELLALAGGAPKQQQEEPVRLACRQHPQEAAVGMCGSCRAGLCAHCFDRFIPARCLGCAMAWAGQRRRRLLLPALWFFLVLGVVAFLIANSATLLGHGLP